MNAMAGRSSLPRSRGIGHASSSLVAAAALALAGPARGIEHPAAGSPELAAQEIVARNAAARGGADAWRAVRTMVWAGHLESAHAPMPDMPFLLAQKRPNKTRFEIDAVREKTVRVFDGTQGWNVRPGQDGRPEARPFTPQELGFALRAPGIAGPLLDADARGSVVAVEGLEPVDGRPAYRLAVRLASGERDRVWVDARSFLDVKFERSAPGSATAPVTLFYRDYKLVDGLQVPTTIETGATPTMRADRLTIERIAVNPDLDDALFANPAAQPRRSRIRQGGAAASRADARDAAAEPAASEVAGPR
jgi:hypothetical protein